jgi:hypothetical protein
LLIALLVTGLYWPGLNGFFLFDDFNNLNALTNVAGNSIFSQAMQDFIFSGNAGPLGRPLSLLTFAMQADAWPDNIFPFKLFNLLVHAANAVLVYVVCLQLGRIVKLDEAAVFVTAVLTATLWALHPLHTTAVLYVIQRMTLLGSFFMLIGVVCYLHYRSRITLQTGSKYLVPLTLGVGITGFLGLLCKENAAVLLLYILVIEYTIFSAVVINPRIRLWRVFVLWLPFALLVMIALLYAITISASYADIVEFTMLERLLTESRILWLYIGQSFTPNIASGRLFYTPELSTSLFSPLSTLLACAAWLTAICLAIKFRRQYPIFALAVLWYLAGHSIESTIIPLELYFNHRNYLPIVGPLFGFVYLLAMWRARTDRSLQKLYWIVPGLMIVIAGWQTSFSTRLWQQPLSLAADWYASDPAELRNAEFYAIEIARTGDAGALTASQVYDAILERNPRDLRPLFNRMLMTCISSAVPLPAAAIVNSHISKSRDTERDVETPINELVRQTLSGNCPGVPLAYLEATLQQALPKLNDQVRSQTLFGLARIHLQAGDTAVALSLYDQAFPIMEDPGILFSKAILQLQLADATAALATIEQAHTLVLQKNDIFTGTRESKLAMLSELKASARKMLDATEVPAADIQ